MTDRDPDHAPLWTAIVIIYVLLMAVIFVAAYHDHNHEQRIKALEEQR